MDELILKAAEGLKVQQAMKELIAELTKRGLVKQEGNNITLADSGVWKAQDDKEDDKAKK